ncbi:hypothetical protein CHUUTOTORO_01090 [Serratia phage vB_SmaM-ChuuTotoro]|nr:hypothetical protein CHUUTOTORO_01090 [Serratia phage vB_SmaM-ChuuTotoro]
MKVKVVLCAKCLTVYRIADQKRDFCPGCKKQIFFSNYEEEDKGEVFHGKGS